jgi:hypothetical protein
MALTKVTTGGIKDGTITNEDISTTTSISQDKLAATPGASSIASGLMIPADKNKLDGVADNANNYSHPSAHTVSEVTGLQGLLDGKTTETYVNTQITNVIGAAPAALDTLTELAAALGDDANYAATVTTALAGKVDDSQVLTNVPSGALFTDTNTVYTHPTNHAISVVTGLQSALDAKVDDSQVLTDVPSGALFTDTNTTYSVGDGGLTQVNFTTADNTKLDGIEAGANVTDTTNVTTAGALMDSEVTNLAQVKAFDTTDYATAAQGTTANAALPKADGAMTGNVSSVKPITSQFKYFNSGTTDVLITAASADTRNMSPNGTDGGRYLGEANCRAGSRYLHFRVSGHNNMFGFKLNGYLYNRGYIDSQVYGYKYSGTSINNYTQNTGPATASAYRLPNNGDMVILVDSKSSGYSEGAIRLSDISHSAANSSSFIVAVIATNSTTNPF